MKKEQSTNLDQLRRKIDTVDHKLLILLKQRMMLSQNIGRIKQDKKLAIKNQRREIEILNNVKRKAVQLGLSDLFIIKIFKLIMSESKNKQRNNNT